MLVNGYNFNYCGLDVHSYYKLYGFEERIVLNSRGKSIEFIIPEVDSMFLLEKFEGKFNKALNILCNNVIKDIDNFFIS